MEENNNPIQTSGDNTQTSGTKKSPNKLGLTSFILSLVGLVIAGLPCGIVAIITGIMGLVKFDANNEGHKWMAIVGIILGAIDAVLVTINIFMQASALL